MQGSFNSCQFHVQTSTISWMYVLECSGLYMGPCWSLTACSYCQCNWNGLRWLEFLASGRPEQCPFVKLQYKLHSWSTSFWFVLSVKDETWLNHISLYCNILWVWLKNGMPNGPAESFIRTFKPFFGGIEPYMPYVRNICHSCHLYAVHAPPTHTDYMQSASIGHLCHAHGPNIAPTNSDSPTLQSFLTLIIWSSQVPKSRQSMARRWWQWEGCRDLRRKGHRPNASIPGGTGHCPGDPSCPGIIVGRTCWVFASYMNCHYPLVNGATQGAIQIHNQKGRI